MYVAADRVRDLAELDFIARLDVLPAPTLTVPELYGGEGVVPPVEAPPEGSPVVGIVDSGVRSAHPLLAGAVIVADAIGTGIEEGEDQHGHGTMVAALVLHGPVDAAIKRALPLRPLCRIVSARVLNAVAEFPDEQLWEADLAQAIEWCANQGASVVNLSVGNDRAPMSVSRQTSAAAVIDDLARRLGLVVVTCTGNIPPLDYLAAVDDSAASSYPAQLLADPRACLIVSSTGGPSLDGRRHYHRSGCRWAQFTGGRYHEAYGEARLALPVHPIRPWAREGCQARTRGGGWHNWN